VRTIPPSPGEQSLRDRVAGKPDVTDQIRMILAIQRLTVTRHKIVSLLQRLGA
jgi:hypothetical protein